MKVTNFAGGISQSDLYLSECPFRGWRESALLLKQDTDTRQAKTDGTGIDAVLGLLAAFTVGLFSLWLTLVLIGLIGLNNSAGQLLTSLGLRMVVAAGFALVICIVAFPLFAPWLVVFVAVYLLLPRKSMLRKWWLFTLTGFLVGVAGLWIDALIYSPFPSGSAHSLNVPLLMTGSIPAAVLGGATCFAATVLERVIHRKSSQAEADDQTATPSKDSFNLPNPPNEFETLANWEFETPR